MEESTAPTPEPSTDAEYEAAVNELLAQIVWMNEQMGSKSGDRALCINNGAPGGLG
jgi:hypothetical protein